MMMSFRYPLRMPLFVATIIAVAITSAFSPSNSLSFPSSSVPVEQKLAALESSSSTQEGTALPKVTKAEEVVQRYFDGVNEKDPIMLRSCFGASATIRDICSTNNNRRTVNSQLLVDRCMEFVTAHPDCFVRCHYGPTEQRRTNDETWVFANWYEIGHWSGDSCGIMTPNPPLPMACEGQTRFKVSEDDEPKIEELVVTRTFTEWENALIAKKKCEDVNNHYIFSSNNDNELLRSMVITAEKAARAAGKVILDGQESLDSSVSEQKVNIKDIVTKYDKITQDVIEQTIRKEFPHPSFLGEENVAAGGDASTEALARALSNGSDDYVWIVDPIDGTANFASGLNLCGVTIAVVDKKTNKALIGVIYDPHREEMFVAVDGRGAYCNQKPIQSNNNASLLQDTIINAGCPADPNAFAASMRGASALNSKCRGLRVIACSALTLAWIASNRLGAHFGYDLSSWDLVAGALIIREAGGKITNINGSPYDVQTRSMLATTKSCSGGVHDEILQVLKEADAVSFERTN